MGDILYKTLKEIVVHYYLKLNRSFFKDRPYIFPGCQPANWAYFVIAEYTSSSACDAVVNFVYILYGKVRKAIGVK